MGHAHRYGLAKVGPLLTDVAAVEEGGTVNVTLSTEHMELPSDRMTIRIDPMRLASDPKLGARPSCRPMILAALQTLFAI